MATRPVLVALLAALSLPPTAALAQGDAVSMSVNPLMFEAGDKVVLSVVVKTGAAPIENARLDLYINLDGDATEYRGKNTTRADLGTIPANTTTAPFDIGVMIPAAPGSKLRLVAYVLSGEADYVGESGAGSGPSAQLSFIHQCQRDSGGTSAKATRVTCLYKPPQIAVGGRVNK